MHPSDLSLPISEYRPEQPDIIRWILSQYDAGKRYVVLQAPPGIGKSVIAAAVARSRSARWIAVTGTKQLQDQYAGTFRGMLDMRGRGNFACLLEGIKTADEGLCTVGADCEYEFSADGGAIPCPYYERKRQSRLAPEVVTSYAYFLRDSGERAGALGGRGLVVLDEAHEIEDHIRGYKEVDLSLRARTALGIRELAPNSLDWLRGIRDLGTAWLDSHHGLLGTWAVADPRSRREYTAVRRLVEELGPVLAALERDRGSWVANAFGDALTYRPVLVDGIARAGLLESGERFLLMSATINEADLAEIGLKPGEYAYRSVPSPFPVGNRPVVNLGKVRVGRSITEEQKQAWVRQIDHLLSMHGDEKGLVHTANYQLAQYLLVHSRFTSRLMTHDSGSRTSQLDSFKTTQKPMVLVSPSMTTGVDLPYDACRFQILGKLAWPNQGDPQVRKRMEMPGGDRWYASKACNHLGQSYGRAVRAADDAAIFYIVDATYNVLAARWSGLLPRFFKEAVIS